MGELVGYARVSTSEQRLDLQIDALKAAGVHPDRIHVDKLSGASKKRKGLEFALMDLREGDTLVVWRLDRLSRSVRQFYDILDRVSKAGASFKSLTESFDFTSSSGKFVLGILGLVADFERQAIRERTKAGIEALRKRRNGKKWKWGRELFMTSERIKLVGDHLNGRNGHKRMTGPKVAEKLGISTASVYAHWRQSAPGKFVRKYPAEREKKANHHMVLKD